jgi:ParB family transcriptional regulator, chromosome partitioning protein
MGKIEELLRSAGPSIAQSASLRQAPAAMPSLGDANRVSDPRRDGLKRSQEFWLVPMDRIDADREQPREGGFDRTIDPETGEERVNPEFQRLVDSLRRDGLLQPITLEHGSEPGRFKVQIGERRFRAARTLGWDKIPAKVIEPNPNAPPGQTLARQIIENVIREDLKPIEQAWSFRTLLTTYGWTSAELGQALGYSAGFISQRLALLDLTPAIQGRVESGEIDAMRAYHVSRIEDPETQAEVVERIVEEKLSQKETQEVVKQVKAREPKASKSNGKGRGTKPKASKAEPTTTKERVIRTSNGHKVAISARKAFDRLALVETLREALATVEAEVELETGESGEKVA